MRNMKNIDIRRVNARGRYIDLNIPLMFDLTDEEILYLRKMYNNPKIAKDRVIKKQEQRVYKLTREQTYNSGKHRTKGKVKNNMGVKVIIGGLVVSLALSSIFYLKEDSALYTLADSKSVSNYSDTIDLEDFNIEIPIGHLSELDDVGQEANKALNEEEEERKLLIKDICNIYQVNYDVVYNKLVEITNNFTDSKYLNGYIEGVTCKGDVVYANSEEELLIYTIRCMKQLPGNLGMSSDNLYINNGYSSGDNYFEQINRVSKILGINRCLLYAIVQSESGFNSEMFNSINNPAGLKNSYGEWWSFSTKEEGFFELGMEVLKYYRIIGKDPSQIDYDTLAQIRDIHAPLSDGNDYWLPNVVECLNYAQMNEAEMFENKTENNGLSY